jgi:hypothetical protein
MNGAKVWVGNGLTGGNYDGAVSIGTIQFVANKSPYIFTDLNQEGSSVQIQGSATSGEAYVMLAEVEVHTFFFSKYHI